MAEEPTDPSLLGRDDQAAQELDAIATALAHDLRAPLRAIDGFSRILLANHAETMPDQTQHYLALVRDAGTELADLLDDLVDVVGMTRMPLEPRDVDPAQLARELIDAGEVGEIRHFRARYLQDWGDDPTLDTWRFHPDESGSGALGDLGTHVVDLARFLVGEIADRGQQIRDGFGLRFGNADAGRRRFVVGEELRDHLAAEIVEPDQAAGQQDQQQPDDDEPAHHPYRTLARLIADRLTLEMAFGYDIHVMHFLQLPIVPNSATARGPDA